MGIKRIYGKRLHSYTTIDNLPRALLMGPLTKEVWEQLGKALDELDLIRDEIKILILRRKRDFTFRCAQKANGRERSIGF